MSNIRKGKRVLETIESEYEEFLKNNTKKIILDVDPIDHVIERCFRIFSFYDRKAVFNKDANTYKLEISYLKFDENEVIRDILSLGSNVMVMEPKRIQKEVLKRIKAASIQYR
jgi:predicted DNA-binding transcriptional regulator YafY